VLCCCLRLQKVCKVAKHNVTSKGVLISVNTLSECTKVKVFSSEQYLMQPQFTAGLCSRSYTILCL